MTEEDENRIKEWEAIIFGAELGEPPAIDLHEEADAYDGATRTEQFIDQQFMAGERVVKIIHGKGHGRMREAVQSTLAQSDLIEYFRDSVRPGEQMGVTYAVLAHKK